MLQLLAERLGPDRAREVEAAILRALNATYLRCEAVHEKKHGHDQHTYGTTAYRLAWFRLEHELKEFDFLKVTRPRNTLKIEGPNFVLHVRKAGRSREDVRAARFDKGQPAVSAHENVGQLELIEQGKKPRDRLQFRHLYLCHCGRAGVGLTGIYLGIPIDPAKTGNPWYKLETLVERQEPPVPPSKHQSFDRQPAPKRKLRPRRRRATDDAP